MKTSNRAFTLAEVLVVIVIIGILAALLLPAVAKSRGAATVTLAKQKISSITLALDQFYNDFGYYPPTTGCFNPATGDFTGPAFGDYAYGKALVHCLCTKWVKGTGDEGAGNVIVTGYAKTIGKAPVNGGPYLEVKASDLCYLDGDTRWPELADPWGHAYIYIPRADYLKSDGTYNAGALVGVNPNPSASPLADHYKRNEFQLISLGPDGWTPGLNPNPKSMLDSNPSHTWRYFDITLDAWNQWPTYNPAKVGTDCDLSSPALNPVGKPMGADDINNWK